MYFLGIIFAFGALFGWGFGDFAIEHTSQKVGPMKALLFINLLGGLGILPFVYRQIPLLWSDYQTFLILIGAGIVAFFASILQYQAFIGTKLSVVEPILGLEMPLTIFLAIYLAGEKLGIFQTLITVVIFIGLVLAITKHHLQLHYHRRLFEPGIILSIGAAICMAALNVAVGFSSRELPPLLVIWFVHAFIAVAGLIYFMIFRHESQNILKSFKNYRYLIIITALIDNLAWISYAYATKNIPISLAITISESYIVLAVLLGLFVNRERLKHHQLIGIALACAGVILLTSLNPNI
jgi:drug/metabolite transporter (DMT)-like permease